MAGSGAPSLKVLTYNTYIRTSYLGEEEEMKDERIEEFQKVMGQYDLLLLQEMFGGQSKSHIRKAKFIERAKELGFPYSYYIVSPLVRAKREGKKTKYMEDDGQLVLSKYEILAQHRLKFKHEVVPDRFADKGANFVLIKVRDDFLVGTISCHGQSTHFTGDEDYEDETRIGRKKQFKDVIAWAKDLDHNIRKLQKEKRAFQYAFFFGGDLNVQGIADSPQSFGEGDYQDLMKLVKGGGHFKAHDLLLEAKGGKQVPTYADVKTDANGKMVPVDTSLTDKADWVDGRARLDYFFSLDSAKKGEANVAGSFDIDGDGDFSINLGGNNSLAIPSKSERPERKLFQWSPDGNFKEFKLDLNLAGSNLGPEDPYDLECFQGHNGSEGREFAKFLNVDTAWKRAAMASKATPAELSMQLAKLVQEHGGVKVDGVDTAPFFRDPTPGKPFTQLSDHYGITATISLSPEG